VMVVDALDNGLTLTAVPQFGIPLERMEADAAGRVAAALAGEGAGRAGREEILIAKIGECEAMPGFATTGAAIVPPAVPAAHVAPPNSRNQLAKRKCRFGSTLG